MEKGESLPIIGSVVRVEERTTGLYDSSLSLLHLDSTVAFTEGIAEYISKYVSEQTNEHVVNHVSQALLPGMPFNARAML